MISNKTYFQVVIGGIFSVFILSILILAINSSISCVDKRGCIRPWCNYDWLSFEYQLAVSNQNSICPFQKTSSKLEFTEENIEIYLKGIDEDLK